MPSDLETIFCAITSTSLDSNTTPPREQASTISFPIESPRQTSPNPSSPKISNRFMLLQRPGSVQTAFPRQICAMFPMSQYYQPRWSKIFPNPGAHRYPERCACCQRNEQATVVPKPGSDDN